MALPQTLFQLVALLLLVVPGIVFTAARRHLRGPGPDEKDFSVRLVHAIAASVVFDSLYLVAAGPWLVETFAGIEGAQPIALKNPRESGAAILVLTVLLPLLTAGIWHVRFRKELWPFKLAERRHSTPTAWDYVAPSKAGCYVRVHTDDGKWVGGYIPEGAAFVATYPEPRDLFIPQQFKMSSSGEFESEIEGSLGVYVPLTGSSRVEWVLPEPVSESDTPAVG